MLYPSARKTLSTVLILISKGTFLTETTHQKNSCDSLTGYLFPYFNSHCYYNPEVNMDVPSVIFRHNYTMETHTLVTHDGYILRMFRLSTHEKTGGQSTKTPILLHHGIFCSSATFTHIGKKSLAFRLADLGYDVWLANARGSTYSKGHVNLTVSDKAFWNFCLDTLAQDLGLMLKLVAEVTQKTGQIVYIGHSMGTTVGFMYAASRPKEAQKLMQGMVALAPSAYFAAVPAAPLYGLIFENMAAFLGTTPCGSSIYNLLQFIQTYDSGKFAMYDYGSIQNSKRYGQPEPPIYDLNKINLPVYLFAGKEDFIVSKSSVDRLYKELGSSEKEVIYIPRTDKPGYNHFDYLYAKDVEDFFYPELFPLLKSKHP